MNSSRRQVNVHEAKTHLSRLLARVAAGEEVTIARAGKPIARLVSVAPVVHHRTPGRYAGKGRVADDFDDSLPEDLQRLFEGGPQK
ncbi:MAG: type II toxin-antitoxin system Phd/YefM family antitoxin [Candidatus Riflebacteria bacterium]|nr:type II toxin-antitoxin system Phd/YefM family antitoxin [Candidatus Riflebacteria bacterium]